MIKFKIVFLALLLSLSSCINNKKSDTTKEAKKGQKSPNVIVVLVDDLGYGDVSALNQNSKINTPNIDKWANSGVNFTNAHSNSAVCTPTRYGILTGRYAFRSSLKERVIGGYSSNLINTDRETVPSFLRKNNYETACIGKWHLGWDWANIEAGIENVDFTKPIKNGPTDLGFDYFYGICGSLDMPPYVYVENDMPASVPKIVTENKDYQGTWRKGVIADDFVHEEALPELTNRVVSYLDKKKGQEKPFFLYFPLTAPHTPILPTKEFQGKSGLDNPYADFVLMVDWTVGQVQEALKKNGLVENTIVIFTSDNGASPRSDFKQLATKGHNPSGIFRGTKADAFEGGHHVPFFVTWGKNITSKTDTRLVSTTDIFATLADLIGKDYKETVAEDSFSFLSAFSESTATTRESVVNHSIHGTFAIQKGDWKYIDAPDSGGWSFPNPRSRADQKVIAKLPKVQLYNLKEDPSETTNLQDKYPEKVAMLKAMLQEQIDNGRSTKGIKLTNDPRKEWKVASHK